MFNILRTRHNKRYFADDIWKYIFLNENAWIPINISLKFIPKGPINNIPALVQIMAWCRPGDEPLSESTMVSLPTHICVTRPQWVNKLNVSSKLCGQFKIHKRTRIWPLTLWKTLLTCRARYDGRLNRSNDVGWSVPIKYSPPLCLAMYWGSIYSPNFFRSTISIP